MAIPLNTIDFQTGRMDDITILHEDQISQTTIAALHVSDIDMHYLRRLMIFATGVLRRQGLATAKEYVLARLKDRAELR